MNSFRFSIVALLLLIALPSFAVKASDRTQFGSDIHVLPGEKTGDVTCVNCSIYVRGQIAGDATAVHGNIILETGSEVAGDVTAVWGSVRAENETRIAGDLTAVAGSVHRDPQSIASGEITSLQGTKWLLVIVLPPILFLGGVIALIAWLIQRNRRIPPAPVYGVSQQNTRA